MDSAVAQAGADQVWVMDAESTDGSAAAIAGRIPDGHLRAVPNKGFSASNNRGIELTSAPFVLLLNPDAVLRHGALDALLASAEAQSARRHHRAGHPQPRRLGAGELVGALPVAVRRSSGCACGASRKRVRGNRQLSPQDPDTHQAGRLGDRCVHARAPRGDRGRRA